MNLSQIIKELIKSRKNSNTELDSKRHIAGYKKEFVANSRDMPVKFYKTKYKEDNFKSRRQIQCHKRKNYIKRLK